MKILVTGNMGYVGPSVVQELRVAYPAATLVGLDMGYFAHMLTNAPMLPECRTDVQYFGDVRTPPRDALAGVDAVVHLAAISNDPMGQRFEEVTLDINHRATVELAARVKQEGASAFVFASSCSVYGAGGDLPRTEGSPVNPLTAYARSKVLAERELAPLATDGFRVTILRFATACGMSERLRLDLVLNDFTAAAVASGAIRILSDGTAWRPLIHVKDMARAIAWAIGRRADQGGRTLAMNVGREDWNFRVRDLANAVQQVVRGVEVCMSPGAVADSRSYQVDFGLFRRLAPEHQPRYEILSTIAELEDGLGAMGFKDPGFRESSHIRLNVLTRLRKEGLVSADLSWIGKDGEDSVRPNS
jgi:nucleoside-diphosphate-sugar epimerase